MSMSPNEDHLHPAHGHGVEYEHDDLGSRGVFGFFIGLAVTGVIIYFIVVGMYTFLDKYEQSQMTAMSPLTKPEDSAMVGARRVPPDYVENRFKDNGAPLLEVDERGQLKTFVLDQEKELNSYGWVDEKAGVAHIPIDHAIDLLAQRGLPVYQPGSANAAGTAAPKAPATKAAAKQ
ncbi:MAG TPA: hypothetical protein VNW47_10210 [Terriglobales bacterium]|nr:hypothetical protein [Terriglobales bacterium]